MTTRRGAAERLHALIDTTDGADHLEINMNRAGVCYAIAAIDSEFDEVAVYEGSDLGPDMIAAANVIMAGKVSGAYSFPTGAE